MAERCPICKSPLWQGPFLRNLKCPRCGAEFRPTVPWTYFQLLLVLFVLLSLSVVIVFSGHNVWLIFLFLLGVALFFWYLPKLIDLKRVRDGLSIHGPVTNEELQMEFSYRDWDEEEEDKPIRFSPLYYLSVVTLLLLFALILFRILA